MVLEKANIEDNGEYKESESERQDQKEKHLFFKLEVCLVINLSFYFAKDHNLVFVCCLVI